MSHTADYDCAIIGGGPAGATAATILAQQGRNVMVLEQSLFPRPHIGESLMPQTYWTFKRLGMLEKMEASNFPRKESVQFVSTSGKDSQPFYFTDRDDSPCSITWQVERDVFDRMMLDNAISQGVIVREGVRVKEVLFEGGKAVGVRVVTDAGSEDTFAKVVVDASGMSSILAKQLKLRRPDPKFKNAAIYAYYKGAYRDEGRNSGATIIIHMPKRDGWFWYIPLCNGVTSIGVVAPPSYLCTGRGNDPLVTLDEEIAKCPGILRRLEKAERITKGFVTTDFSYRADQMAGDGWVLIGDAFGFMDPVYSSGIMLALKSGELAADAIHQGLSDKDLSGNKLGCFAPELLHGMNMIRQLVEAFYNRDFSFGQFMKEFPHHRDHLVRILIGDVFNDEVAQMFDTMRQWITLPQPSDLKTGTETT